MLCIVSPSLHVWTFENAEYTSRTNLKKNLAHKRLCKMVFWSYTIVCSTGTIEMIYSAGRGRKGTKLLNIFLNKRDMCTLWSVTRISILIGIVSILFIALCFLFFSHCRTIFSQSCPAMPTRYNLCGNTDRIPI